MTYEEIITTIESICENHKFVNTFGYGDISDMNTPDTNEAPDYPYMFLNPINIQADNKVSRFTFNLISMTQAKDTKADIIKHQSLCIQYLTDVISKFNMTLVHPLVEISTPFTITPFKERFSDDVVGATGALTIIYNSPLDICDKPI